MYRQRSLRSSRFSSVLFWGIASLLALSTASPTADAARAAPRATPVASDVSPRQVEAAIAKAKEYLYSKLQNGSWPGGGEEGNGQEGGVTAIATYALLAAGESHQDERLRAAINTMVDFDMEGIYAMGLRAQIWNLVPPSDRIKKAAKRDAELLRVAAMETNKTKGLYRYTLKSTQYDHSCSQYGVLGMWACAQVGVEVPLDYWKAVDKVWRDHQKDDGGWAYQVNEGGSTATMTAAGVATLFITQDYLNQGRDMNCIGNIHDDAIQKGLDWMSKNFADVRRNRVYYCLYGVERIGVASGYKYFGTVDWYKDGCDYLLKTQKPDGSWGRIPDTCFGILFLVRGRAPVVMNKLIYEIDRAGDNKILANWNQRPRDAANLVKWLSKSMERDLNWQVVNLKVDPDQLHDAPLLYICGNQNVSFPKADKEKLKSYIEQGGIILANADCGSKQFADSIKKLGQELFPMYEFRELPADHPIYANQQYKRFKTRPQIIGMSNGARELILLFPNTDPSRYWQMMVVGGREDYYQIAANIFLYAVDKANLRTKDETYIVRKDPSVKPSQTVKVARLEYAGNWDPEPGGWRRLANIMNNTHQVDLQVQPVKLGEGKLSKEYSVAHLTGTSGFRLGAVAQKELADFVNAGGTLIVDAAGGSAEFAGAVERELAAVVQGPRSVLRRDHPIYANMPGAEAGLYRMYARRVLSDLRSPRIMGIESAGRASVFISAEDLSVGLVGQAVDGIVGYRPEVASELMARILLYSAEKR
jgi:hypothetical protein